MGVFVQFQKLLDAYRMFTNQLKYSTQKAAISDPIHTTNRLASWYKVRYCGPHKMVQTASLLGTQAHALG